jgi:hypothetical protein
MVCDGVERRRSSVVTMTKYLIVGIGGGVGSFSHDAPVMVSVIDSEDKIQKTAAIPRSSRRRGTDRHV